MHLITDGSSLLWTLRNYTTLSSSASPQKKLQLSLGLCVHWTICQGFDSAWCGWTNPKNISYLQQKLRSSVFGGNSTYLRSDIYLTGFQALVRLFPLFCISLGVASGQQSVQKKKNTQKNMLICAFPSCMFKHVPGYWSTYWRSLWTCHVQTQHVEMLGSFVLPCILPSQPSIWLAWKVTPA